MCRLSVVFSLLDTLLCFRLQALQQLQQDVLQLRRQVSQLADCIAEHTPKPSHETNPSELHSQTVLSPHAEHLQELTQKLARQAQLSEELARKLAEQAQDAESRRQELMEACAHSENLAHRLSVHSEQLTRQLAEQTQKASEWEKRAARLAEEMVLTKQALANQQAVSPSLHFAVCHTTGIGASILLLVFK